MGELIDFVTRRQHQIAEEWADLLNTTLASKPVKRWFDDVDRAGLFGNAYVEIHADGSSTVLVVVEFAHGPELYLATAFHDLFQWSDDGGLTYLSIRRNEG